MAKRDSINGVGTSPTRSQAALRRRLEHRVEEGFTTYRGTGSELIAAGLIVPEYLPGTPGGPVASKSYERDGRRHIVNINSRASSPITYWLDVASVTIEARREERRRQAEAARADYKLSAREVREDKLRAAIRSGEYLPLSRDESSEWFTIWTGTREELIGTGVCREFHFPTSPKRRINGDELSSEVCFRRPGAVSWDTKHLARDYYCHLVRWDEQTLASRKRSGLYTQPEDRPDYYADISKYAAHCELAIKWLSAVLLPTISGDHEQKTLGTKSYCYPKEVVEKVTACVEHAAQLLQATSPLSLRQPTRKPTISDPGFLRFIAASTGVAPPAP